MNTNLYKAFSLLMLLPLAYVMLVYFNGCQDEISQPILVNPSELAEVESLLASQERVPILDHSADRPPNTGKVCRKSNWKKSIGGVDTFFYSTFYVVAHKNKDGYWHNPPGDFALIYYDYQDKPFQKKSYNDQTSEDVVQKGRGGSVRFPARMKWIGQDSIVEIVHKQNSWETDIETREGVIPCVIQLNALDFTDTICIGHFNCDRWVSGCGRYY